MSGFLLIDKPSGPTSHDICDKVRKITGERRVGHAGTLDPFATGLLIVGVGREATREFPKLVGLDKRYRAVLRLGAASDTDDRTGRINIQDPASMIQESEIEKVLKKFIGKIGQIPPMYSAKKIAGKKLYELAREGKSVERAPVPVQIFKLQATSYKPPYLTLEIHCSSGTYVRSLARDIGEALGCGAYVEELERLGIGPFSIEEAVPIDDIAAKDGLEKHIIAAETIVRRAMSCQGN